MGSNFVVHVSNGHHYWHPDFTWALGFGLLEFADFVITNPDGEFICRIRKFK